MSKQMLMPDDFCRIPPLKVFMLGVATFGLYLVYWYEIQYAKSKKMNRSVFKDFLKSYFFVICSFMLSEKINALLGKKERSINLTKNTFFLSKFVLVMAVEAFFYYYYGIHVFLLAALIVESAYASMLQTVINEYIPQWHDTIHPWQKFELFHVVVLVTGISLLLLFQITENPLLFFKK